MTDAPISPGSVAWRQPGNNAHVAGLWRGGTTPSGPILIDYYGHCALRLTAPSGLTLVFDPWRNDPSGAWGLWFPKPFPRIRVDVAASTHAHFDHDAIDHVDATCILDRMIGTWRFADVTITGIPDKHATECPGWYKWIDAVKEGGVSPYPPDNPGHLDMMTYIVETGGLRILIWGDNRHDAPEDVWAAWGHVDVMTLPVDGSEHILSFAQADAIIERLKPKIVIPTHYLVPGVSSILSTLQGIDAWVDGKQARLPVDGARLNLAADMVAACDRHIAFFGASVAKD